MTKIYTTITALLLACSAWAADMYYDGLYFNIISDNELSLVHHGDVVEEYDDLAYFLTVENNYTNLNPRIVIPDRLNYNGVTYTVTTIDYSAFMGCKHLTHITMPETITRIEGAAFEGCSSLVSINLPEGLNYLGYRAFFGCVSLSNLTLPSTIEDIDYGALDSTAWLANQPNGVVYINDILYGYNGQLPNSAFIKVKDGTRKIAAEAFYDCTQLYYIYIPGSVKTIGSLAFYGCTSLARVDFSPGLEDLFGNAFAGCKSLTHLVLPDGLKWIGGVNLDGCTALQSVTIPASVEEVFSGDNVFYTSVSPSVTIRYAGTKAQWDDIAGHLFEDEASTPTVICSDGKF
jgi:hypothetical protein